MQLGKTQNQWFLGKQSKQKWSKIKSRIFTAMFRFPNHKLKLNAPEQSQSAGEVSLLTCAIK